MKTTFLSVAGACACAWAALAFDRTAFVDAEGVLRWSDDKGEVAVFGVNYYTPFHVEYRETKARGYDAKDVIRKDVAHFRRLGLDAIRLHCFDSEISDRDGNLVDNDHLDLLDYLIAECASNGICTVLTPISGWGGCDPCRDNSFRWGHTRIDLATNATLVAAQVRYEEAFARHVNRYTRRRPRRKSCAACGAAAHRRWSAPAATAAISSTGPQKASGASSSIPASCPAPTPIPAAGR